MNQARSYSATELKQTEIGLLPVGWDVIRLGELVDRNCLLLLNGFSCSNRNQHGIGLPHLRPMNIDDDGQIKLAGLNYVEIDRDVTRYLMRHGDVLFNNTNSEELVGKAAFWDLEGDYGLSNHMTILRVLKPDKLDSFYLAAYLHKLWFDGYARSICRRYVNQAGISLERIKSIPVPLPPLPEQRRVAAVLNSIQDEIAAQDDIIAGAREFKRSLMQRLFTYGPGEHPSETKQTKIGEMPSHWKAIQVSRVAQKPQYGFTASAIWEDTGVKLLRITDITDRGVLWSSVPFCRCPVEKRDKYLLQDNDIVFARTGATTGKSYIIKDCPTSVFASYLIRLRINKGIDPSYIYYYFNTNAYWQQVESNKSGSTQPGVNATTLSNLLIPVPPTLAEQQEVACQLSAVDAKIAVEEDRKKALQDLFKSTLHQLMTGQIRMLDDEEVSS